MAKVALLIGVSEYEVGLNPLPAAVKDVVALERILKDSEMGDFDEVKILTNPEPQAMQYEVETLFSGRSKDDFVLLFFSGHGIKDDSNNLYFATRITKKSAKGDLIRSTAVPARFVHEVMNNSRAKRQAIILDCCFSGAFDPYLLSKDDGSVDLQGQLGAEGRVVLTSSSSTQYSFEQQGSDLSLYTRYLIEGIETGAGDLNEDGKISVQELHEYATSKVQETAPSMTPMMLGLKDMGFDIVLAKAKVTDPKLRYRKTASRYYDAGKIRPVGRAVLNTVRQKLGLTKEEATEIENELLRPFQERLANLKQYRETLIAEAEHEYPLGDSARDGLKELQKMFGLRDEDVLPIYETLENIRAASSHNNSQSFEVSTTQSTLEETKNMVPPSYSSESKTSDTIEVFFSYSHKDEELRDELETHLVMMKRQGFISDWHDRDIDAGNEWESEILHHLNSAHVILLLVSNNFLSSDFCYDKEMLRAMERHELKEARVIPIIIKPCDWNGAPFGKLQALPKNAKPITKWEDRDEAFLNVAQGIRRAVQQMNSTS